MKKSIMIVLTLVLVVGVFVGCASTSETESNTDNMVKTTEAPMTEEPMTETPVSHAPMTEAPMTEAPMTEEPSEEMMMGELTEDGYIDVTPEEAKKLIDSTPNLVIIDVSPLFDNGHLPGAINHYVGDGSLDTAIKTLDKTVPYLVYCHSDSASISGSKKLVAAGFEPVYRIIGNYGAWVAAGYPVE